MNSKHLLLCSSLIAVLAVMGCGDDAGQSNTAVTPPDNPERGLPAQGPPLGGIETPDFGEDESESADGMEDIVADPDLADCCPVTFALLDPYEAADEVSVVLRGDIPGISQEDGLPLEYVDGFWEATACVSIEYQASYYYEVALPTDEDGVLFTEERLNPVVPTTREDDGVRNAFAPADSCESDELGIHSRLQE